jgi:hypothetical protein
VGSHGWSGNAPATDEEAIDRSLDAADDIIAGRDSSMRPFDLQFSGGASGNRTRFGVLVAEANPH